jgi:hypothetical protein
MPPRSNAFRRRVPYLFSIGALGWNSPVELLPYIGAEIRDQLHGYNLHILRDVAMTAFAISVDINFGGTVQDRIFNWLAQLTTNPRGHTCQGHYLVRPYNRMAFNSLVDLIEYATIVAPLPQGNALAGMVHIDPTWFAKLICESNEGGYVNPAIIYPFTPNQFRNTDLCTFPNNRGNIGRAIHGAGAIRQCPCIASAAQCGDRPGCQWVPMPNDPALPQGGGCVARLADPLTMGHAVKNYALPHHNPKAGDFWLSGIPPSPSVINPGGFVRRPNGPGYYFVPTLHGAPAAYNNSPPPAVPISPIPDLESNNSNAGSSPGSNNGGGGSHAASIGGSPPHLMGGDEDNAEEMGGGEDNAEEEVGGGEDNAEEEVGGGEDNAEEEVGGGETNTGNVGGRRNIRQQRRSSRAYTRSQRRSARPLRQSTQRARRESQRRCFLSGKGKK